MKVHSVIVDGFFLPEEYPQVRKDIFALEYKDEHYDLDDITYEQIAKDVPQNIQDYVKRTLESLLHEPIEVKLCVVRRSDKDRKVQALPHHDADISQFNAIIYFNTDGSATLTCVNKQTGLYKKPETDEERLVYKLGRQVAEDWLPVTICPAAHNRLFIVRSDLIHTMWIPNNAIGQGEGEDARTVLVCFFDIVPRAAA